MSRAYKDKLHNDYLNLNGTGAIANFEQASGADMAQLMLAAQNRGAPDLSAAGAKTLGTNVGAGHLATVTADAANTVTVDDVSSLFVGQVIDIVSSTYFTVRADNRTITAINAVTKVVTYNGADASASVVAGDRVVLGTPYNNATLSGADQERTAGLQ